MIGLRSRFT